MAKGRTPAKTIYIPRMMGVHRRKALTPEVLDLIRRRTQPFLVHGMTFPIEQILAECYIQGCVDALNAQDNQGVPNG